MKVGGLVGETGYGTITDSSSEGIVKAEDLYIGGLVGDGGYGSISKSFSNVDVWGGAEVGGLAGRNLGNIQECYSTGDVNSTGYNAGGFVGENIFGTIKNSYSTSIVTGNVTVGGFCGKNGWWTSYLEDSYSSGHVYGNLNVGGFCGSNQDTVSDCFFDNLTSGTNSSSGGTGKTTKQMMDKDTFSDAGWDFNIWNIIEGRTYPYLDDIEYADPVIITENVEDAYEDTLYSVHYISSNEVPGHTYSTWTISTNAAWLTMYNNGTLSGTPENSHVGPYHIKVICTDARQVSTSMEFDLTVHNTNDAPMITSTTEGNATEDLLYSTQFKASDIDPTNDTLTWSMETGPDWLTMNSSTGWLNGTPTNDDVGTHVVNISVSDGNGGSDWTRFTITVENTNDDPTITTSPQGSVNEDSVYSIYLEAEDIDPVSTSFFWSMETDASWLALTGNHLYGNPKNKDVGSYWVNISVRDGHGGSDWLNSTIVVINTNDDPLFTFTPDTTAIEDILYSTRLTAVDPDPTADTLLWALESGPNWLTVDRNTGWLNGTPTNDDVGSHHINVSVRDGNGGLDWKEFTITVINVNDDPEITTRTPPSTVNEDTVYSVHFSAVDIDPTPTTFEWSMETNATWLSLNGNHLHGTPTNDDVGIYEVNITLRDGDGGSDWRYFTVEVINTNDDPYFTVDPCTRATEDEYYNTTLEAEDPDPTDDLLTWSLVKAPAWLSIDPETGVLSGTPTNADVGIWGIIVTVSDDNGGSAMIEFDLTVENTNDDPVIITEPITEIEEDEEYFLRLIATDIDPGITTFQWALETNASWLSLDVDTLRGIPENSDVGTFYVNITVYDGDHGHDNLFFLIDVTNINDIPEITTEPATQAMEDEYYSVYFEAVDVDEGDRLQWSLSAPDWLSIDPETGLLNGTPTNDDVGLHWIKVTVTDLEGETDSISFMLEVINTNDAPTWIRLPGDWNMTEEDLLTGYASATDVDGDTLSYSISSTPELDITIDPASGMILCNMPPPGSYQVTVTATDGTETIDTTFHVNVSEVPDVIIPTKETDTDSDGMPDWWEDLYGLDPEDPSDAEGDLDGDGITNLEEFKGRTSPTEDNSEPEEKGTSPVFFILIAILAILALVFLLLFILKKPEANVVETGPQQEEGPSDMETDVPDQDLEGQGPPEVPEEEPIPIPDGGSSDPITEGP
ncbi:MAG: putative Ig domain-containing protein [Thermoplasmatota archaeon]